MAGQARAAFRRSGWRWCARWSPARRVNILVNDAAPAAQVRALLERGGVPLTRVRLHEVPTDDAWMRDHGPTFVTRGDGGASWRLIDWIYNAWGGKYPPWEHDDRVPQRAGARCSACRRFEPGIVLEGGSIDVNGARHAADHRGVPAQSESQSAAARARRSSSTCATTSACGTCCGSATASSATTPTATSTT